MYQNLKLQIWKRGMRQNRLAQLIGIHETLLSKIVNGFRQPDPAVRARIAAVLDSDEEWLFSAEDPLPPRGPEPSAPEPEIAESNP
jgi:transcriptional regulator with XRE-family HTH domain